MALNRQIEHENSIAHLQGIYMVEALLSTVGNMFADKRSKRFEYPTKPHDLNLNIDRATKTQSEQERQIQLFAASLTTAMNNFQLSKEQGVE